MSAEPVRIGKYIVHPAAALFPPMIEEAFEDLKSSIDKRGQAMPILVQGDTLLDGRNRLRACLELGIEPRIQEYTGSRTAFELIRDLNIVRRDLTEEQRAQIIEDMYHMSLAQKAAEQKRAAGKEGGRGHKKNLQMNSSEGFTPAQKPKPAPTTRRILAAKAGVSEHKIHQAATVRKYAPELVEKVKAGDMRLKDAARTAKEKAKSTSTQPQRRPRSVSTKSLIENGIRLLKRLVRRCPPEQRTAMKQTFIRYLEKEACP